MKEEFDNAISTALVTKDVNFFGRASYDIASKFGVSYKTVHNRFHSLFGTGFREYIYSKVIPTKEQMISAILNSSDAKECKKLLKLPSKLMLGVYDRFFGVSTYGKAKEIILMSKPTEVRLSALREDNIALLMSQYIGDGYYDRKRHALRISHGSKQVEYLRWKVGMIIEGYNLQTSEIKEHTHSQGHKYYEWYSRKLGNVDFPLDKSKVPAMLTPLGWLLWYFDDGTYGQDITICTNLQSVANAGMEELKTYGIKSRVNKCSNANAYTLTMCGGANSVLFYKGFIEPFLSIIPKCMQYKTIIKTKI